MEGDLSQSHRFDVEPTTSTHFAWIRTRLSVERTMMAWARTAIAMIGFGFTIVKFFDSLKSAEGISPALVPSAPRYMGLLLIGTGIGALGVALWQYIALVRYLWKGEFATIAGAEDVPRVSPVFWVTVLLLLIGFFALGSVLIRVH